MLTFIRMQLKENRRVPIPCPQFECPATLRPANARVVQLLNKEMNQKLQLQFHECTKEFMYCPNEKCSKTIFIESENPRDACPDCKQSICQSFKSTVHPALFCKAYRKLPRCKCGQEEQELFGLALKMAGYNVLFVDV